MIEKILLLSTLTIAISCLRCKDCPDGLIYHLPVTLTPQKDTFNIGDTIWVSINFPKELTDEQAGIRNTFDNFDFKLGTRAIRYDSAHEYSTKIFDLFSQVGLGPTYTYSFFDEYGIVPTYDGLEYRYHGYTVLKESGVFGIYFGTRYSDRIDPVDLGGNCKHEAVNLYCITNNGENNNIELVKPYFGGNPKNWDNDFKISGGFAFVVR